MWVGVTLLYYDCVIITGALNLLVAEVVALSNPDPVQNCNSFDAQKFEVFYLQYIVHNS